MTTRPVTLVRSPTLMKAEPEGDAVVPDGEVVMLCLHPINRAMFQERDKVNHCGAAVIGILNTSGSGSERLSPSQRRQRRRLQEKAAR